MASPGDGSAVRRWLRAVRPDPATVRSDALAGLPTAIGSVPDGMAASVLAGVNPIYGLYASFAGPIAGGLSASTRLMVITTTSAAALAAGSALDQVEPGQRPQMLVGITLLAGALMIIAGLASWGRYTRFVSHSVMMGFLTGVAANIIFSQVQDLTASDAQGAFPLARALDVVTNPSRVSLPSALVGLGALVLIAALARSRYASFGALVALALPTAAALVLGLDGVAKVADIGEIPRGLPLPSLPDLRLLLSFDVVTGALAIAAIVLVQGAGVAESAPNPGGQTSDANGDFVAQGVGNLASGLFRGLPVGGSVGQTALNVSSGARTRWASICSGAWMLVILVAFSGVVGQVAVPTLAAVLVYAAVGSIRIPEIATVLRTGSTSQIAMGTTFLATLFLPVAAAVGIGVALSLILQLNQEALDLAVVALVPDGDGRLLVRPAPRRLVNHDVTLLDVYGSLYYAGARTLGARLPDPAGSVSPVVILRLRGRTTLGATSFVVLAGYAERLADVGGRLYLSGVEPALLEQFRRIERVDVTGPVRVFGATDVLGASSRQAYADAEAWLVSHNAPRDDAT